MNYTRQARVDEPLQLRGTLAHIDAGDGAFAEADGAAVGRMSVAITVAADEPGNGLMQVWIVAYDENTFALRVLRDKLLEGGEVAVWSKRRRGEDGGVEGDFCGNKLRGLTCALERAGDNDVDLRLESGEHAGHQHALLLTLFDEAALGVQDRVFTRDASIRMTHEIQVHRNQCMELNAGTTP